MSLTKGRPLHCVQFPTNHATMNTPKLFDNTTVHAFLDGYTTPAELIQDHPDADDIFSGVLGLMTEGNTATRTLSRRTLFTVLRLCPIISTGAVLELAAGVLADRSCRQYAQVARVASNAFLPLAIRNSGPVPDWIKNETAATEALNASIQNGNLYKGTRATPSLRL